MQFRMSRITCLSILVVGLVVPLATCSDAPAGQDPIHLYSNVGLHLGAMGTAVAINSTDEFFLSGLPNVTYYDIVAINHWPLKLTCILHVQNHTDVSWSYSSGDESGWTNLEPTSANTSQVTNHMNCSELDVRTVISMTNINTAFLMSRSVTRVRCESAANGSLVSMTHLQQIPTLQAPTSCPLVPCTACSNNATSTKPPTVGEPVLFWTIVGVASAGWLVLIITVACVSCSPKDKSPIKSSKPNNMRKRQTSNPELEKQRRESAAEMRRQARDEVMRGNTDSVLFTNPLFESDSVRRQYEEPRRPPLPLPSEMNSPSTQWPNSQSPLTSSVSQPHLPSTIDRTQPMPLPRPPGDNIRPRLSRPPSGQDRPLMSLPRAVSNEYQPQPSPHLGSVETRSKQDLQPPVVPTTQRPTLPRAIRPVEHTHELSPNPVLQLPNTVPKRDNGSGLPVAHQAGHSPYLQSRSTSAVDGFAVSDYVDPGDGEQWGLPLSCPQPQEYVVVTEADPTDPYMDMVSVQNGQPQVPLGSLYKATGDDMITSAPVSMPRRVRKSSTPSSAPNFRKSSYPKLP